MIIIIQSMDIKNDQVVEEFQKKGFSFIRDAMNNPNHLEDVTGLTDMKKESEDVQFDIEPAEDDFDDL